MGAAVHPRAGLTIGRAVARLLLLAAAAVCIWQAPFAFGDAGRAISRWIGVGPQRRELEPAHAVDVDPHALLAARRLIPAHTIYYVDPGEPKPGLASIAYRPLSFYWLFPRRYTNERRRAKWVLAYADSLPHVGLHYAAVWHVASGTDVAEVRR